MKQKLEKISILSLSMLLLSTYSISAAMPAMEQYYSGYSRAAVEQLVSISSFAMMVVILLNTWICRFLNQRASITLGIILIVTGGTAPIFVQDYTFVFAARILMGCGIGLINPLAINMINERYEGKERADLLGFRSSAEVLGNAVLTFFAGILLAHGWTKTFLVYLAAVLVLILYYCFVTPDKTVKVQTEDTAKGGIAETKGYRGFLLSTFALGFLTITINNCVTLRIPTVTLERGLGTDTQSSMVLSAMMIMGIVAGVIFGKLTQLLKHQIMAAFLLILGVSLLLLAGSKHMWVLLLAAMINGLAYNTLATIIFHRVSVKLPQNIMHIGTTCGLVGCNLGASACPYLMGLIGLADERSYIPFVVYGVFVIILGAAVFVQSRLLYRQNPCT